MGDVGAGHSLRREAREGASSVAREPLRAAGANPTARAHTDVAHSAAARQVGASPRSSRACQAAGRLARGGKRVLTTQLPGGA
eukprot:13146782-Alexandrium_andersonii.AAC.1